MRFFLARRSRVTVVIIVAVILAAALYGGGQYFFLVQQKAPDITLPVTSPSNCDVVYNDVKEALIDAVQHNKTVCQLVVGPGNAVTVSSVIEQLSNLRVLDLSDNRIEELPTWIGSLSQLRELNVRNNRLTSIPQELGALSNLTTLDVRGNPLGQDVIDTLEQLLSQTQIRSSVYFE